MTASCPGFLDRHGIWNNGFDCSSPRVCCGTDIDRYCCVISTSPVSHLSLSSSSSSVTFDHPISHPSNTNLLNKWICLQIFTIGLFLAVTLLIFIIIYHCLLSLRRHQQDRRMSLLQIPLPAASPLLVEHRRLTTNRISTISSTPSDMKSRCTDTSIILNTPLNLYPTGNCGSSSTSSSSYYMFPNEFEHLCK